MNTKSLIDIIFVAAILIGVLGAYFVKRGRDANALDVLLFGVPAALAIYASHWLFVFVRQGGEGDAYARLVALLALLVTALLAVLFSLLCLFATTLAFINSPAFRVRVLVAAAAALVFALAPPMIAAALILLVGIVAKPLGKPVRLGLLVVGGSVLATYPLTSRFGHWSLGGDGTGPGYRVGVGSGLDGEEWALENVPESVEACDRASTDKAFRNGCKAKFERMARQAEQPQRQPEN